jgi:ABC-type lipoprotein export system ATPase subunit
MLLVVDNVTKQFAGSPPLVVLHGISLGVEEGEFVALVGPSGAGKTTLLNIVSTLDVPSRGAIRIAGVDVHRLGQRELNKFRSRNLGFIFQDDLLLPHLTALENVSLPGRIARISRRQSRRRAEELLGRVGLSDRMEHLPGQLSGGQRQRVNLARALVNSPALLLADEPTARLDQGTGRGIIQLLQELNDQLRVTILMVTHDHEVALVAKRRVEFIDGRIASDQRRPAGANDEPAPSGPPG